MLVWDLDATLMRRNVEVWPLFVPIFDVLLAVAASGRLTNVLFAVAACFAWFVGEADDGCDTTSDRADSCWVRTYQFLPAKHARHQGILPSAFVQRDQDFQWWNDPDRGCYYQV